MRIIRRRGRSFACVLTQFLLIVGCVVQTPQQKSAIPALPADIPPTAQLDTVCKCALRQAAGCVDNA